MAKSTDDYRYTVAIGQMTWPEEMELHEALKLYYRFQSLITGEHLKVVRL